jgi:hypothetical protein
LSWSSIHDAKAIGESVKYTVCGRFAISTANELGELLDFLAKRRLVTATSEQTKGAPRVSFRAIGPGDERGHPHVDPLISLISHNL